MVESVVTKVPFSVEQIRRDFPILSQQVQGKPLVYLDNAATMQKPRIVIDAIKDHYETTNANVHRGIHALSEQSTFAYENARKKVQSFINAKQSHEILFTRGTTEAINLIAQTFGRQQLEAGDEILISAIEHHSNIVPWQLLCEEIGANLKVIPCNEAGELDQAIYKQLLTEKTRIVAINHISNAIGTVNPIKSMIAEAHARHIPVLIDGAQAAAHTPIDVQDLDCDFYAFSGHKTLGPTGIGVLYGKAALLENLPPYQGGGDMIRTVSFAKGSTYASLPYRFEAGTPNIAGAIGLAKAIEYLQSIGFENIHHHEQALLNYATEKLTQIEGLKLIGQAKNKASIVSFVLEGIHPHDIGTILDQEGIAIRSGHHCAMPLMERFAVPATSRASFAFYNTYSEIDSLVAGLQLVKRIFKR